MNFEILIPVWGERYIAQFAEFGLRSLLAPGNVPWLAQNYNVRMTVLTAAASRPFVDAEPAFRRLAELATIGIVEIDDLIETYGPNYSVILTRAYNRAMALNRDMLGTAFVYLVGDLVFSDGAMRTVARQMESGNSACVMCSPRVNAQRIGPILTSLGGATQLAVSSRHMADLLIEYPHSTLIAKIVRDDEINLSIAHQFFWRPQPDVMVARCFLAHMLCIRPTRRPRDIAAPCDFSFLEELAPDAPYHFLSDSDEFISLEMQDAFHECKYIRSFPLPPEEVAESIAAWATAQHHKFCRETFVFRGGSSEYSHESGRALTQPYVDKLLATIPPPMDHRHHFFWLGGLGAPVVAPFSSARARERELDRAPTVLRRLVEAHLDRCKTGRIELAVCASDAPAPIEAVLTERARVTARVAPGRFHDVAEDIIGTGDDVLFVLCGQMQDFLDLYSRPSRLYRLLRLAGPTRTMLLCFEISASALREGRPSRYHLNELFALGLATLARFGLQARVHDLAASVFDDRQGLVIEILPDETAETAPRSYLAQDDMLMGFRGEAATAHV